LFAIQDYILSKYQHARYLKGRNKIHSEGGGAQLLRAEIVGRKWETILDELFHGLELIRGSTEKTSNETGI